MTVSWTAPGSLPNSYTVTAQPGGLTATVAGSATSASLTTTLSGVAYNVSVVANYAGSTQTATATLVSPPAALSVPLTTDVVPWVWYDAADPTVVRCNSSGAITEWYNKGTSAGSTNANVSVTGTVSYGSTTMNNRPTVFCNPSAYLTTGSIAATSQAFAYFVVVRTPTNIATNNSYLNIFMGGSGTTISTKVPDIQVRYVGGSHTATSVIPGVAHTTLVDIASPQNIVQFYSSVNSATVANNYFGVNGSSQTLAISNAASGIITGTGYTYIINQKDPNTAVNPALEVAEIIGYQGEITATQRQQIEGYLAWKWGLQAQLPAAHAFSTVNMASSMAAYVRPRMYVSTFADLTTQMGTLLLRGLAVDPSNNIYTCINETSVLKITPAGVVSTFTTLGGFQNRTAVACDLSGNVYVSERNSPNSRIRKIAPDGTQIYAYSLPPNNYGVYVDRQGCAFTSFDDGSFYKINAAGTSHVSDPFSGKKGVLAWDTSDNVYIFNFDNKLYRLSPDYSTSTFIAGSGTDALVDGIGAGASFSWFSRMVVDANRNIYAANYNCIRMITPGGVVRTIAGSTTGATGFVNGLDMTARFNGIFNGSLEGLGMDTAGNLYATDHTNKAIRKISYGALNQVGTLVSSGLTAPNGVKTDKFGNIYLSNYGGHTVVRISPTGSLTPFAGSGSVGGLNNVGTSATFNNPTSVELDELGNLYVAEGSGHRIRKITPAGLVTTVAGTGSAGALDGTGTGASLSFPCCTTFGPDGNIYVCDATGHKIRKVSRAGVVSRYAGTGSSGSSDASGAPLNATMNVPIQIVFDSARNMYITERVNNIIRKISPDYVISKFAGSGISDVLDNNGLSARFKSPNSMVIDSTDTIYVADMDGHVIRRIKPNGDVLTIAGTALSAGFNDATGTAAKFSTPNYITQDAAGNLWVADGNNNRLRQIAVNIPPSGSVSITGTLTQGQTISANVSALADSDRLGTFSYAWYSSATSGGVYTAIAGATSASLTLAEAQVAKYIKVVVSYTDGRGSAEAVSSAAVGSVVNVNDNAVGLDICGAFISGQAVSALTANIVDPDGNAPPYTYQWSSSTQPSSGFVDIAGANASTYTIAESEIGKYIRLTVSYTNNYSQADSAVATSATAVLRGNTPVSGTLDISGNLREDAVVRAVANLVDPDGLGPLTYIWSTSASADGVFSTDVSGVDLSGITLSFGQTSRYLRVEVRYVDLKGKSENMISSIVGPIVAHGPPDAPTVGVATAGEASITISWAVPTNNGGRPINGYEIRDESGIAVKSVDASANTAIIENLIPGVARRFTVVASNERGFSSPSAQSIAVAPAAPSIASIESGQVSEVIPIPVVVAGIPVVVKKVTPVVEADGTKSVVFAPEPEKTAVAIANLPAEVEKVVVATAAPQNGFTTLKIAAFDSSGSNVSNFASSPLSITLDIPGYTSATLLVRTFQEIGGPTTETLTATRNPNGSYTMTLSHLTYIRVSENVPCFVAGTKILTSAGYKAIENIKDGELIATSDGRALPCKMYITEIDATTKENAPYFIPANTFAPRCPAADITLSPLHAIQLRRGVWQVPKIAATMYAGVRQLPIGSSCTYYHLEMPNYLTDNIVAEGTVVEPYGARQLAGRRVAYKFDDVVGGFVRTITEARARGVAVKRT